jgi:hypothetical protein
MKRGWQPGDLRVLLTTQRPARVRLGKARGEYNESGVPQKADAVGTLSHFRVGPILLQKDFAHSSAQD